MQNMQTHVENMQKLADMQKQIVKNAARRRPPSRPVSGSSRLPWGVWCVRLMPPPLEQTGLDLRALTSRLSFAVQVARFLICQGGECNAFCNLTSSRLQLQGAAYSSGVGELNITIIPAFAGIC